ncbi:MAG TPA: bifunctional 2-polyprenyl-6-hydroxyphenol methylase/3-demethylubiquinol 3-O-methyltransferase UbiG [Rhizomicrobium sp.]|nr:bifunctional 2-polyprenyl-6-hydroxyphenol methylase/3-demethylubiquinol 3-O-methyltransferase UbiG [Rhizomicrobium sp.]
MEETSPGAGTLDESEVAKFARLAGEWWDPNGAFAPLHKFNPVRLQFIRDCAAAQFGRDVRSVRPFAGLSLLDLGCGGGLVAEPMARLGFSVTGCDAGADAVRAAEAHARESGLSLAYRVATPETLVAESFGFDVVLALEIVEHVADVESFVRTTAQLVRPGGLLAMATINRTLKSFALAKIAAEYVLRWVPAGTHDWNRFIPPARLTAALEASGLAVTRRQGFAFDPLAWSWRLTGDLDVNYALAAARPS